METGLNCKVCFQNYNTANQKPMITIPCCHTTCLRCLTSIKRNDQSYKCPFCKEDIIDEKPNYALLEIPGIIQAEEIKIKTIFENGSVSGKYYQSNTSSEMFFDYFSLKEGILKGKGRDEIGEFTMLGTYDNDENVMFKKQYVGQHSVEYHGLFTKINEEAFKIEGKWRIDLQTDKFILEGLIQA